jgi:sporulation protein YlmC with PRC-barrel domain/Cu/Ag efflux protein CusF
MKSAKSIMVMFAIVSLFLATTTFAAQKSEKQGSTTKQYSKEHEATMKQRGQENAESTKGSFSHQGISPEIVRASKLIGTEVQNRQGEDLGDIEDIAIDPQTGDVAYAVLASGGFLGLGEKYFAIPWSSFEPQTDEEGEVDRLVLDIDKERLKEAPGFDKNNWPDMADRKWGKDIHAFYGQEPYWKRQSTSQDEARERLATAGMSAGSQEQDTEQYKAGSQQSGAMPARSSQQQETVTATVQEVDQASGNITLQMPDGETVDMQVSDKLASQLQTGDRVKVEVRKSQMAQESQSGQSASMPSQSQMQARSSQQQEAVTATVQNVDQSSQKLELQTAEGNSIELQAPEELISELQTGDSVEVVIRKESPAQGSPSGQSSGKQSQQGQSDSEKYQHSESKQKSQR